MILCTGNTENHQLQLWWASQLVFFLYMLHRVKERSANAHGNLHLCGESTSSYFKHKLAGLHAVLSPVSWTGTRHGEYSTKGIYSALTRPGITRGSNLQQIQQGNQFGTAFLVVRLVSVVPAMLTWLSTDKNNKKPCSRDKNEKGFGIRCWNQIQSQLPISLYSWLI